MDDGPELAVLPLLSGLRVFSNLDEEQVARVASVARVLTLHEGDELPLPEERDYPLYVVISGKVRQTLLVGGGKTKLVVLKRGDVFGADVLLLGKRTMYWIDGLAETQLLAIEDQDLAPLVREMPPLGENIKAIFAIYRITRKKFFNWLGEDEIVHLVLRKHPAYLLISLLMPLVLAWLAVFIILVAALKDVSAFQLVIEWAGGITLVAAVLWAAWIYMDWENDYYIVTDQRVVWLERVYWLYDSRQEGPLSAVRSAEVNTSLWGRILGYGNVTVSVFMGQLVFWGIAQPKAVRDLIDALRKSAAAHVAETDRYVMESIIRRKIDPPTPTPQDEPKPEETPQKVAVNARQRDPLRKRIRNYFRTRVEEGDVITYRKHLWVLLIKTFLPSLLLVGILAVTIYLYMRSVSGLMQYPSPIVILLMGIFVMFFPALVWIYQYVDWRNDIYQITADKIIDSERKPLGTEFTKSAPLENILGLDYIRVGLLGVLLNMGHVIANTGTETKFIFYNIHDPARAQRDIFNHMYEFRRRKQLSEATSEWEQVSDWLAAYHRQAEEMRQKKNTSQV